MFDDSEINVTKFDSCIEDKRLFVEGSCQTDNIQDRNTEAQIAEITSVGLQVTSEDTLSNLNISFSKDSENVDLFLNNVLPYLYDELRNCSDDYLKLHKKLTWNNNENEKFELGDDPTKLEEIVKVDYKDALVSHLAWNSNGLLLGTAFSKKIHESWCNHEMSINLYRASKHSFERNTSRIIKSTSCIKQIQFHPFIPSILAGGFQNGEVIIWDIKNADTITFFKSKENAADDCHNEAITFLSWKEDESNLNLITAGKDGKILFWKVLLSNLTYMVYKRFVIVGNDERELWRKGTYIEDLRIGFWSDKDADFIATADEKIFHCSLRNNDDGPLSKYHNPIRFNYLPHKGVITSVACLLCHSESKFFATCAMDGEIRIYQSRNIIPIFLLCPKKLALDITWIGRDNTLISWGRSGIVEYYKFNFSEKSYMSSASYNVGRNISAVALHPKRKESIAFGCENGEVIILQSFII